MTKQGVPINHQGQLRPFIITALLSGLWINLSEVARYFLAVRPMMQDTFVSIPHIAPINVPIFLSWMVWDTLLVFAHAAIVWIALERFGNTLRVAAVSGTFVWAAIFVILWLGLFNMALATPEILAVALPLSWIEMIVAAIIVSMCRKRFLKL